MRSPKHYAVACRAPNGQIVVDTEPVEKTWIGRQKWLMIPFLRGTFALLDSMFLGHKAMNFAGAVQIDERYQPEGKEIEEPKPPSWTLPLIFLVASIIAIIFIPGDKTFARVVAIGAAVTSLMAIPPIRARMGRAFESVAVPMAMVIGLSVGFLIFDYLPQLVAEAAGRRVKLSPTGMNYLAEIVKVVIFIGYLAAIAKLEAVKELFKYHGAEHKAINALELDRRVNVETSGAQTRLHPRCGTSFMIIVLFVGFIFMPLIPRYPFGHPLGHTALDALVRFGIVLCCLPLVAGISYELLKLAGKYRHKKWVSVAFAPGLFSQRVLTTVEPETKHLEVAVASLQAVMIAEKTGALTKTAHWDNFVKPDDVEVLDSAHANEQSPDELV